MRSQGSNADLIDSKAHGLFTKYFIFKIYRDNPCINFCWGHKWIGVWKCHKFPLSSNLPIYEAEHQVLLSWYRREENRGVSSPAILIKGTLTLSGLTFPCAENQHGERNLSGAPTALACRQTWRGIQVCVL